MECLLHVLSDSSTSTIPISGVRSNRLCVCVPPFLLMYMYVVCTCMVHCTYFVVTHVRTCIYFCSKPTSSGSAPHLVAANIMAIHDNAGIRISQQVHHSFMYMYMYMYMHRVYTSVTCTCTFSYTHSTCQTHTHERISHAERMHLGLQCTRFASVCHVHVFRMQT